MRERVCEVFFLFCVRVSHFFSMHSRKQARCNTRKISCARNREARSRVKHADDVLLIANSRGSDALLKHQRVVDDCGEWCSDNNSR